MSAVFAMGTLVKSDETSKINGNVDLIRLIVAGMAERAEQYQ